MPFSTGQSSRKGVRLPFDAATACRSPKSSLTFSTSGMRGYLMTRYPASCSRRSRSLSRSSFPRWLLSSSSITATTCIALSQITKSAIFLSKRFLAAVLRAVSSAPKLTWASITRSGSACVSRLYMAASFLVSGCFRLGLSFVFPLLPFAFRPAAAAMSRTNPTITTVVVDTFSPEKTSVLSPSPSNTTGPRTLAARSKPVMVRGTNHAAWTEISLFLQQQSCSSPMCGVFPVAADGNPSD